jgi:uncharacterized protein
MQDADYEWDDDKADSNAHDHAVTFDEARAVFNDPAAITGEDTAHSQTEIRYITVGYSAKARLLMVVFTLREERIRIISARKAKGIWKQLYEKHETD